MKLLRNSIILLVVLGLLAGAYVFAGRFKEFQANDKEKDATETIKIFSFDPGKVKRIILEKPEGTFEFEKKGNEWKVIQPKDLVRLDSLKVESIASTMGNLNAEKIIDEKPDDISLYGLDKPVTVTVKLEDNTSKALEVGSLTLTKDSYYVREKGKNKVYSISTYDGNALVLSKNDFKRRNLYDIKQDDIIRLSMEKDGKLLFSARKIGENRFELTAPIIAEADMEAIMTMLKSVESSVIVNFIEENAKDLAKYGLDKPSYTIEVETKTVKKKLLIGDEKQKNAELYAKFADSNEVFTVGVGTYAFLDKPITEISDRFIYVTNIKNVEELKVEFDGKVVNCKIKTNPKDSSKDRFWVNGQEVTKLTDEAGSQLFRKFYQSVIGVLITDIKPNETPRGDAEVRFTYKLKTEPKTMVIEFVPRDKYSYHVKRNGKYTGLVVDKKRFDEYDGLRVTYKKLINAMEKKK